MASKNDNVTVLDLAEQPEPDPAATKEADLEQARRLSIQSRAREGRDPLGFQVFRWLVKGAATIPPWWSVQRDAELRKYWKRPDHLAGAVFNMTAKMTAIPRRVEARDPSNKDDVERALRFNENLVHGAEFGEGWVTFYGKWVEDLLTQDNGAFAEVIGPGRPDGPLTGAAVTISHLDSIRCTRTGDPEFPVLYLDDDGKRYKLHYSRVIYTSQMPSPITEMNGVGFCAVSRCVNIAQTLLDILTYKQEKLGSRPHRGLMVTKGGLDPEDLNLALTMAESEMADQNLTRYSRFVLVGDRTLTEAGVDLIDLAGLPDGFDEQTALTLGMAGIALAFGVDARELFPALTAGATRADALLAHLKQRGKAPGQILEVTEQLFNMKYLPPGLRLVFDFQDDAEDRQAAEIQNTRSTRRVNDLGAGVTNVRVEREKMVAKGELTRQQFERMELEDGRLEDGSSVLTLLFSASGEASRYLEFANDNPLDTENNDVLEIMSDLVANQAAALEALNSAKSITRRWEIQKAIATLEELKKLYLGPLGLPPEGAPMPDNRMRREDTLTPQDEETSRTDDDLREDTDDRQPKEVSQLADPFGAESLLTKSAQTYAKGLRDAIRGLWRGETNLPGFVFAMEATISRHFREAFVDGANEVGVLEGELNTNELQELRLAIANEIQFILPFADRILENSRDNGGKLGPLISRVPLWVNRYLGLRDRAKVLVGKDQKLKWIRHALDSCKSCLALAGKVKRASFWREHDVRPKHPRKLACMLDADGPDVCRCQFEVTSDPVTPGPLPILP